MAEYAPQAIKDLFEQVRAAMPSAQMGGIIGDAAHTYGYHRGRHYVGGDDYSVQYAEDQQGDGEAACGLDITWGNGQDHYTVTQRMLDAKHDGRLSVVRSYLGSVDGWSVVGWDYPGGYPITSDPTHLWHGHWSFDRLTATDSAAMRAVADVITGGSTTGDDVLNDDDKNWIKNTIAEILRSEGVSGAGDAGHMRKGGYDSMVAENVAAVIRSEGVSGAGDGTQPWAQKYVREIVREEVETALE